MVDVVQLVPRADHYVADLGFGVRPVYAVLSVRRKGLAEAGHDYHPAPKTQEIVGFPDLKRGIKKTPVQGGGGLRHRWLDAKGRTIYEWDSSHGELEAYRSSDESHLGAFDHLTGEQTKAAQKTVISKSICED
ncbi:colicin E3/pyocin S6 family cytotoxin [Pseudomonas corrugata]